MVGLGVLIVLDRLPGKAVASFREATWSKWMQIVRYIPLSRMREWWGVGPHGGCGGDRLCGVGMLAQEECCKADGGVAGESEKAMLCD